MRSGWQQVNCYPGVCGNIGFFWQELGKKEGEVRWGREEKEEKVEYFARSSSTQKSVVNILNILTKVLAKFSIRTHNDPWNIFICSGNETAF